MMGFGVTLRGSHGGYNYENRDLKQIEDKGDLMLLTVYHRDIGRQEMVLEACKHTWGLPPKWFDIKHISKGTHMLKNIPKDTG